MSIYGDYAISSPHQVHRAPRVAMHPDVRRHRFAMKGAERTRHELQLSLSRKGVCRIVHWTRQDAVVKRLSPDVLVVRLGLEVLTSSECEGIVLATLKEMGDPYLAGGDDVR